MAQALWSVRLAPSPSIGWNTVDRQPNFAGSRMGVTHGCIVVKEYPDCAERRRLEDVINPPECS